MCEEPTWDYETLMPTLVTDIQGFSIHDGPGIRTLVFLKGCGLGCTWCSNPECISGRPEVGFVRNLCIQCGDCAGSCSVDALVSEAGRSPEIHRRRCNGCGACAAACARGALVLYGKAMTVDEVFDKVRRDRMFYEASGGGLTVSGGDPLLHPRFVRALFERCRGEGIHTCVETSGYAAWSAFERVLPATDLILYDLKIIDEEAHGRYTGRSNKRILANARRIDESGVETLFRLPLVPGINDSDKNLADTACFLQSLGPRARHLQLMPYHDYGRGKYDSLDRAYIPTDVVAPTAERLEQIRKELAERGIDCSISL
jgi:pyruvate formate lyase activating enzyme